MKHNDPHKWTVALFAAPQRGNLAAEDVTEFVGGVDDVLCYADERDSEMDWEVHRFVITRGAKAS